MSKTLVIAEKPSVANDIARALGGFLRDVGVLDAAARRERVFR